MTLKNQLLVKEGITLITSFVFAAFVGLLSGSLNLALVIWGTIVLIVYFLQLVGVLSIVRNGAVFASTPVFFTPLGRDIVRHIGESIQRINAQDQRIERLKQRVIKRQSALISARRGVRDSLSVLPEAVVGLDKNQCVEWWNPSAVSLLGLSHALDRGKSIEEIVLDAQFSSYLSDLPTNRPIEVKSPTSEALLLKVRILPIGDGHSILQAQDITVVRQLETVRQDFVENASHELRTPLTVVHGYLETLIDHRPQDQSSHLSKIFDQMYRQTTRIKGIVEDMLTLSKLEQNVSAGSVFVNMTEVLNSVYEEATALSGDRDHQVSVEAQPDLALEANPGNIFTLATNLVSNAVRYTAAGGEIKIRWWAEDSGAYLSVRDNGIGIASDDIKRITERFYRVDVSQSRESGGTGLGLAIVKHVLDGLGGELTITSKVGAGSTFTCYFPMSLVKPN